MQQIDVEVVFRSEDADLNEEGSITCKPEQLGSVEGGTVIRFSAPSINADLELILDLRTLRRVEREGHLEVWGPLEP